MQVKEQLSFDYYKLATAMEVIAVKGMTKVKEDKGGMRVSPQAEEYCPRQRLRRWQRRCHVA